jgi:hypothetical protein
LWRSAGTQHLRFEVADIANRLGFADGMTLTKHTNNKAMEQTDLRTPRAPARLALADHTNRFIAGGRAPCSPEGAEILTAVDSPLAQEVSLSLTHCIGRVEWVC